MMGRILSLIVLFVILGFRAPGGTTALAEPAKLIQKNRNRQYIRP